MFTYSVVIPHKNCVPLLQRCLNSIPKRNDIQVIVVDDVSDLSASERTLMESFANEAFPWPKANGLSFLIQMTFSLQTPLKSWTTMWILITI